MRATWHSRGRVSSPAPLPALPPPDVGEDDCSAEGSQEDDGGVEGADEAAAASTFSMKAARVLRGFSSASLLEVSEAEPVFAMKAANLEVRPAAAGPDPDPVLAVVVAANGEAGAGCVLPVLVGLTVRRAGGAVGGSGLRM